MIIPLGFAQASFFFTGTGAPTGAAVTMGLDPTGGLSPLDVAQIIGAAWSDNVSPVQVQNVDVSQIRVKFGPNATGPSVDHFVTIGGDLVVAQASPQVAMLVKKNTALGGRTNRGRLYMPALPEGEIDQGGNLSGGYFANAQIAWDGFLSDIETLGITMVILHNASSDPTPVTELVVATKVATQRGRVRR